MLIKTSKEIISWSRIDVHSMFSTIIFSNCSILMFVFVRIKKIYKFDRNKLVICLGLWTYSRLEKPLIDFIKPLPRVWRLANKTLVTWQICQQYIFIRTKRPPEQPLTGTIFPIETVYATDQEFISGTHFSQNFDRIGVQQNVLQLCKSSV